MFSGEDTKTEREREGEKEKWRKQFPWIGPTEANPVFLTEHFSAVISSVTWGQASLKLRGNFLGASIFISTRWNSTLKKQNLPWPDGSVG